jgi:hypothetical protein
MPNLKRVPRVTAKKPKRGRGRRARSKHRVSIGDWWRVIRVAMIMKGLRNRRQSPSPSVRQIVLIVISGGLAIVIIRRMSRRVAAAKRARSSDGGTQDQVSAPEAPPEPTTPGADDGLTERVRAEMFEKKN